MMARATMRPRPTPRPRQTQRQRLIRAFHPRRNTRGYEKILRELSPFSHIHAVCYDLTMGVMRSRRTRRDPVNARECAGESRGRATANASRTSVATGPDHAHASAVGATERRGARWSVRAVLSTNRPGAASAASVCPVGSATTAAATARAHAQGGSPRRDEAAEVTPHRRIGNGLGCADGARCRARHRRYSQRGWLLQRRKPDTAECPIELR